MGERLPAFLPRVAVIVLLALAATAGLTYAAGRQLATAPASTTPAAPQRPATLVVPDVRKLAFVFAKGQLQDAGLAWRVSGGVHGFASNTVVSQSPAPGTKLLDTGAPLITLTLTRNAKYPESGEPQDVSPYTPTADRLAEAAVAPAPAAAKTPAATTSTPAATTAAPVTAPATAKPETAAAQYPQNRPPAFVVAGAKKEPLDEMPLPDRAAALGTWLAAHPHRTKANVQHWLYQNAWIVAGARLGWWRGAEALRTLVAVDARTAALWGIGGKSEALARQALTEVEARSK